MSEPVVFISHFEVKEGGLQAYRDLQRAAVTQLEADKPRTLVFLVFHSDDGRRLTVVHVFGDAEAMDLHFEGAAERAERAYEFLVPRGWEIYGQPSEPALEMMRMSAARAGVSLHLEQAFMGGFLRLDSSQHR